MKYGIFPGITRAEYNRIDAVNHSSLKHIDRSPAHYVSAMVEERFESPEQKFGTLVHAYVLEPDTFESRFVAVPDLTLGILNDHGEPYANVKATKEYKARRAAWLRTVGNRTEVEYADLERCEKILKSIRSNASARELIESRADTEVAVVWKDPETGIDCKCLIDHLSHGGAVADLKTTDDASPGAIPRTAVKWNWHTGAAFYLWGLACAGAPAWCFRHLVVEKEPPFAAAVYQLDERSLDAGMAAVRRWLATLAQCRARNEWPAYSQIVEPVTIPAYAMGDQ